MPTAMNKHEKELIVKLNARIGINNLYCAPILYLMNHFNKLRF
jgi:hypothetical protein